MTAVALATFSGVAGRERSAMTCEPPEKRITLKESTGRMLPRRSRISFLEMSRG
jgi:hypothetical protein